MARRRPFFVPLRGAGDGRFGREERRISAPHPLGCENATVLVPEKNRLDVDEMDHEITDGLTICFVNNMKEVLDRALLKEEK